MSHEGAAHNGALRGDAADKRAGLGSFLAMMAFGVPGGVAADFRPTAAHRRTPPHDALATVTAVREPCRPSPIPMPS
ncbi:MAG: hypothetical protein KIT60_06280 [Burkholderiaceae bacterium]|nr:hypothetical protein [Burkholderiaceae bacterium]